MKSGADDIESYLFKKHVREEEEEVEIDCPADVPVTVEQQS